MSVLKVTLLVAGAIFEFMGIVAMAFPDAVPYAVRLSTWLRKQGTRPLVRSIRRLLGWPYRFTLEASPGDYAMAVDRASLSTTISVAAPIEQKVEFLLRREQEAQRDVNDLRDRLDDLATGSSKRLEETRLEIETRFAGELQAYRPLRVLGTIAFVVGLICATYANFIN